MPWLPLMLRLKNRLDVLLPGHRYVFEPGSRPSLVHGSMWDHTLDCALDQGIGEGRLVLLTLSMGRRTLFKKAPIASIFHTSLNLGFAFHAALAEFFMKATPAAHSWTDIDPSERSTLLEAALEHWWPNPRQ
jgi:hypothetical protein